MKYTVRADENHPLWETFDDKNVSLTHREPAIQSLNCTSYFYHANIFYCFVFSLLGQNWVWKAHGP